MAKKKAEESGKAPLFVRYMNRPEPGLPGIFLNIPPDKATVQELIDQINKVKSFPLQSV